MLIPDWYLVAVVLINLFGLSMFIISSYVYNPFMLMKLILLNLSVVLFWTVFNFFLVLYFLTRKVDPFNFIFPIYYLFMNSFVIFIFYLMFMKQIYVEGEFTNMITIFASLFELSFACFVYYKKNPTKFRSKLFTKLSERFSEF